MFVCADVDECSQTPSPCSNGRCENTPGSFMCVCRSGFKLQGNTCTGENTHNVTYSIEQSKQKINDYTFPLQEQFKL